MDKTIFEVEISNSGPKSYETATVMKMPASFAEFSDALQKARIKDGSFCKNELTCIHYNGLTHAMIGWNANLYDLNLFAQRLASLTEEQKKGMDALLKIKQNHRVAPIPLNQLINLTYNTDICCFAPRVSNHEELGAFLYANEMLSNEAMALLDTTEEGSGFRERLLELLGEQHQEDHGGVFTDFGYAELGGEIKDIYVCQSNETACFHRSDAPVVLEVRKGFFNDPSYDNDKTAVLNLPAADAGIWRAVEKVDAASVDECAFRCVDCLIPFLRDAINNANAIVLLETMKAADKDHRVFKLQFEAGEFDMVIYDQKENSCEIFEIKHSSKQVPFQYRHLVDEDKCQRTERRFGPIQGRYILYRGEDAQMENGVQYWNVENYLKALPTLDIVQVQEIGMQSIEPTL